MVCQVVELVWEEFHIKQADKRGKSVTGESLMAKNHFSNATEHFIDYVKDV